MEGSTVYDESSIDDEIMVLQSIYEEKLEINEDSKNNSTSVSIMLYPATADDVESQFVMLLLEIIVPKQYPEESLEVNFRMSRGLSDDHLRNLKLNMTEHMQTSDKGSILFDLIDLAKDSLTLNNIPSNPCPVCLSPFQAHEEFLKTECFHHLHSYCLHQYIVHHINQLKQTVNPTQRHRQRKTNFEPSTIPCPVCRAPIPYDLDSLATAPAPGHSEPVEIDMTEIKQQIRKMEKIYLNQKKNGGIIDLEEERKKHSLSSIEQAYAARSSVAPTASTTKDNEEIIAEAEPSPDTHSCKHSATNHHRYKPNPGRHMHRQDQRFSLHQHIGGGRRRLPEGSSENKNLVKPHQSIPKETHQRFSFSKSRTYTQPRPNTGGHNHANKPHKHNMQHRNQHSSNGRRTPHDRAKSFAGKDKTINNQHDRNETSYQNRQSMDKPHHSRTTDVSRNEYSKSRQINSPT